MKYIIITLIALLNSTISLADDTWPEVCENVKFTYSLNSITGEDLLFDMTVNIKNTGSDDLTLYCTESNADITTGVILVGFVEECYSLLEPGMTKTLTFKVKRDEISIEKYSLFFKIKNANNSSMYCSEVTDHWFNAPLNIEEVDRTNMKFTSTYYDLLGREVIQPNVKGFYIVEKLYEDGYRINEKVYLTEALLN